MDSYLWACGWSFSREVRFECTLSCMCPIDTWKLDSEYINARISLLTGYEANRQIYRPNDRDQRLINWRCMPLNMLFIVYHGKLMMRGCNKWSSFYGVFTAHIPSHEFMNNLVNSDDGPNICTDGWDLHVNSRIYFRVIHYCSTKMVYLQHCI